VWAFGYSFSDFTTNDKADIDILRQIEAIYNYGIWCNCPVQYIVVFLALGKNSKLYAISKEVVYVI